nr:hypothetical protein [Myxococcota bacterium]
GLGVLARYVPRRRDAELTAASPGTPTVATRRALGVLAVAGLVCTLTLLASPKLGPRLYLASVALTGTAIAGAVCLQLRARWARTTCAVISAAVLAYGAWRCIATYRAVAPVGVARLHLLRDTPDGQRVVVPRYPVGPSRWFLGDDFLVESLRNALASDYGLTGVDLAPVEPRPAAPESR